MDTRIAPRDRVALNPGELWRYRELVYFFAWRDILVRYKQTAIGAAWAVLQPALTMIVFTIVFHRIAGISSEGRPYPVFALCGLIFWTLFTACLVQVSNSLVNNQAVLTKIYFPRIIPPISAMVVGLVDFACAAVLLGGMLAWYGVVPALGALVIVPLAVLTTVVFALGLGLFLATLQVRYRDVRAATPFLVQLGLFLTPVMYPLATVPPGYRRLMELNPMAGVVSTARGSLLHSSGTDWSALGIAFGVAVVSLVLAVLHFQRSERQFADIM